MGQNWDLLVAGEDLTPMRLPLLEKETIVSCIQSKDPNAKVYLFGSRTDDSKQGGDIDLLIESKILTTEVCHQIRWQIWEKIGEQKIDMVLAHDTDPSFLKIIRKQSILLA